MTYMHVIRISSCGTVGQYLADDAASYERGMRVVCRTQRGLEVGEVLASVPAGEKLAPQRPDGEVVRALSDEDESVLGGLERLRVQAIDVCQNLLDQARMSVAVVDAVLPLDGQHICFYVLGSLGTAAHSVARTIGQQFNTNVLFRPVDDSPSECGSGDCGNGGCSSGGCSTCAAASLCRK